MMTSGSMTGSIVSIARSCFGVLCIGCNNSPYGPQIEWRCVIAVCLCTAWPASPALRPLPLPTSWRRWAFHLMMLTGTAEPYCNWVLRKFEQMAHTHTLHVLLSLGYMLYILNICARRHSGWWYQSTISNENAQHAKNTFCGLLFSMKNNYGIS